MDFTRLPRIPNIEEHVEEWCRVSTFEDLQRKLDSDREAVSERRRTEEIVEQELIEVERS